MVADHLGKIDFSQKINFAQTTCLDFWGEGPKWYPKQIHRWTKQIIDTLGFANAGPNIVFDISFEQIWTNKIDSLLIAVAFLWHS